MKSIRYWKRQCDDNNKIENFLSTAKVGYLGVADGIQPYVIPLNYVWWDKAIYVHGAETGRKCEAMNASASVCFTVCEEYGTIADPVPAHTDTAYMSVIVFGKAERVTDIEEATGALQAMLDKYVPGYHKGPLSRQHVLKYRSSLGSGVAVFRIHPESITAKENPLKADMAFYPGRTADLDA